MEKSLSALIAVRNAQSTLRVAVLEMLDIMSELTSLFELVIIDDCSTDATIEVADELTAVYPQLLALRHSGPQGHAAAIRTGIDRSLGEIIFFADEDCRLPLNSVRQFWTALGEYELVLGRPGSPSDRPDAIRGLACPSGGYQMGYRRVLLTVADALGDPPALLAKLQQCGVSWHEMRVDGGAPRRRHRLSPQARPGVAIVTATLADRSVRADRPESEPGKPNRPNYESLDTKKSKKSLSAGRYLYPAEKLVQ